MIIIIVVFAGGGKVALNDNGFFEEALIFGGENELGVGW